MVFEDKMSEVEKQLYKEWVAQHDYETYRCKTTIVVMVLKSGFEIVGTAGCEDPSKFNENLGHEYALKDALRKLGEFVAFYRAETAHQERVETYREKMEKRIEPFVTAKQVDEIVREAIRKAIDGHAKYMHVGIR